MAWDPPHLVEFAWHGGPTQPRGSRVRFELAATADGCRLVLTHSRVDEPVAADFAAGWHGHLDTLASLAARTEPPPDRPTWDELHRHYQASLAQ